MGIVFSNTVAFAAFAISLRKKRGGGSCVETARCQVFQVMIDEWWKLGKVTPNISFDLKRRRVGLKCFRDDGCAVK